MKYYNTQPELVIYEGDYVPAGLTYEEYLYIKKYKPELLGFWAKLAKGLASFGKRIGGRVARRIRAKRKRRRKRQRAERKRRKQEAIAAMIAKQRAIQIQEARRKQNIGLLTAAAGLGLAALLLLGE